MTSLADFKDLEAILERGMRYSTARTTKILEVFCEVEIERNYNGKYTNKDPKLLASEVPNYRQIVQNVVEYLLEDPSRMPTLTNDKIMLLTPSGHFSLMFKSFPRACIITASRLIESKALEKLAEEVK